MLTLRFARDEADGVGVDSTTNVACCGVLEVVVLVDVNAAENVGRCWVTVEELVGVDAAADVTCCRVSEAVVPVEGVNTSVVASWHSVVVVVERAS